MSERALELLALPEDDVPRFLLDIGKLKIYSFNLLNMMSNFDIALLQKGRLSNGHCCGLGCGSGLSGETISENGHHWIGLDISASMLSKFKSLEFTKDSFMYPFNGLSLY